MIRLDSYKVPVVNLFLVKKYANLSLACSGNLPIDWNFAWNDIRDSSCKDCQCVIKLDLDNLCLGLIRFGLYPYPGPPQFVDLELIESHPLSRGKLNNRLAKPVGMWLIWYAIKVALEYCKPLEEEAFVTLVAYEEAVEYYKEKVGMELASPTAIPIGPYEEGFPFRFSFSQAKAFCERVEKKYGRPKK